MSRHGFELLHLVGIKRQCECQFANRVRAGQIQAVTVLLQQRDGQLYDLLEPVVSTHLHRGRGGQTQVSGDSSVRTGEPPGPRQPSGSGGALLTGDSRSGVACVTESTRHPVGINNRNRQPTESRGDAGAPAFVGIDGAGYARNVLCEFRQATSRNVDWLQSGRAPVGETLPIKECQGLVE